MRKRIEGNRRQADTLKLRLGCCDVHGRNLVSLLSVEKGDLLHLGCETTAAELTTGKVLSELIFEDKPAAYLDESSSKHTLSHSLETRRKISHTAPHSRMANQHSFR